jgi:hypothetical protein
MKRLGNGCSTFASVSFTENASTFVIRRLFGRLVLTNRVNWAYAYPRCDTGITRYSGFANGDVNAIILPGI